VQDVHRPGHIQALSHPTRHCRARVEWDLGEQLAVRPAESQLSVRLSIDLIALLMDGSMVPTAEHGEI